MKEVIFSGFGGQGILSASLILAKTVMMNDVNVSWMPSYGPAMRGGTANACVKFGETQEERLGSPLISNADVVVIMNEPSLSFLKQCKPGATVFLNANTVPRDAVIDTDVKIYWVNSDQIAADHNNAKGTSLVMLGAMVEACSFATVDQVLEVMDETFSKKGKASFSKINKEAFLAGVKVIQDYEQ